MMKEFLAFLKEYGIVGLAIAVVIGGKVNTLVESLVKDLITPLIFQPMLSTLGANNIAELNYNGILYGKVVASAIEFMIVAFVVFLFAKLVLKETKVSKK